MPNPPPPSVIDESGLPVTFEAGDVLVAEGAGGDHCFYVLSGEVLVTTTSRAGATIVLGRRGAGSIIGLFTALDGGRRSATVTAKSVIHARRLSSDEVERLLLAEPRLALDELRRLADVVRALSSVITGRSEELRTRTIDLLRTNAEETGDPVFRCTREELAGWLGVTREAVSRTLSDLAADGVVSSRRGEVTLLVRDGQSGGTG